jgi:dTMP kinase
MFATEGTYPDLTLLFDLAPEQGLERIAANKGREVNRLDLEKLPFHNKVRAAFHELAKRYPDRYVIIDAAQPLEKVVADAYDVISKRLKATK